jgi:catechol 2,3-dioxygenase-like lactoylglutathione lyase family enzyme
VTTVWYNVRDLDTARRFYVDKLGFEETYDDPDGGWIRLQRGSATIGLAPGEPADGGVAHVDVDDLKAEAARLREAGVEVGVVLELHGEMRLLDVYDEDGNRIQLAEDIAT